MSETIVGKDFELRSKWIVELSEQRQKIYIEIVNFVYKITQTIGIIAGFGFTAIGKVYDLPLFLFGEAFLISSIFYGIYRVSKLYDNEMLWRDKMINKIDAAGKELMDKSIPEQTRHDNFKAAILEGELKTWIKSPMSSIIILGVIGAIFLILSFVHICRFLII